MAKKKKQNVYMTVDEIRENGFQQEYSNLDGADISSVDDTKTYMTVDEIRKKYEEERWKEFSVDGDRGYHTVDEIRQAALDQGLVKPREIKEEKQEAQPLSPLEKAQQETKQYGNLAGMIKKTETETIPKITDEAIKNYNTSRIGREYLEKYDDSTSYADIQKDIAEVQGKREEDSSNKDAYDLAMAMLKDYVNQNYDLNGTDLSQEAIKRRQEVYDYNQNEIDNINSKVETNEGDTGDLNLDDEETVSKYLNHDKDAVDFFMGYRSGRITQDAANQEKYITMRNYIENAANSDSVRDLRNEVENLRAQNAAYDRTQGQSDRYALQYGDEVKNEKTDLLAGTLHTRNNVPDNFDERVENGNDRFTDMGDISQPAIKRYGGENAVEDYNNMDAHTEMLTSEEKGIYSYLLRNEGEVSANAYLDSLKDVLQKRASETTQEYIDNASGAEKAVLLAASVPMNVYGTVTGFAEDAANIAAGKDIHPYSEAHSMYNTAQQTRSSVAEDIDEATNSWNVLGFSAGDAFQAAMSIPDFMLGALTPSYYAASMSMGAAQSTAKELWEEGATNEQIVAESVLSGAAEYVFERVSLDKIIDVSDKKSLIKTALAGMAIEGSEEANTEIANIISDVLVRGSQSEWNKMIRSYKDQGYSDSEAQAKAFGDMAKRVGYSAIGGAIGGAGGGAGVAVEKGAGLIQNKAERNKYIASVGADVTSAGNTQELIDQAYALDGDSKAVKNIQAQADKVSSLSEKQGAGNRFANWVNDKRTTKATGKLYTSMQENNISRVASAEETEIKTALSKAYAEKIQADVNDKSVSKVVNALYKSEYTDEPLSLSESRIVNNNQNAKAALSEVQSNDDVIRSQINRAQRRATEDMASTAALTGTKEQATEKPAKIDIDDFNLSDDGKTYTADGGEQVDIKSISSVGANDIRVELSNGKTESVKALDLGSEDQAVVYQGIMDMQTRLGAPITASFANAVVNEYNQAKATDADLNTIDFIYDAEEAVRKGYMNDNGGNYAVNLSESAREALFDEGRKIAQEHTKAQQKSVQSRIKGNNSQRKGTVTYEDGIKRSQLNERQQAGVDVLTHIAEETGIDVVFFRSTKDGKGRFSSNFITKNGLSENGQSPNGFWLNGKIYIDVNAGMNGEGLILFTAAHEIVHMIREGSPESFKALADFLVENYAKKGVDVNRLVLKEMTRSTNLNYDAAYEEVIAQSCESFLRDIHLSDKAEQLYKTDKGLATKIKNILNRILNAVKKWYGVAKPQSVEANYVSEMKDALSEAYDKYIAGIRAASQNLRNMEKTADEGGAKYSIRRTQKMTWEEQIESYYNKSGNIRHSDTLVLESALPDFLNSIVSNDLPVALPLRVINKAQHGKNSSHLVSNENIKRLNSAIRSPLAVIYDPNRNSLFFITGLKENTNKPVCVAVSLDSMFDGEKVNCVTTIHSRENIEAYLSGLSGTHIVINNKNELLKLCRELDILERLQNNNKLIDLTVPQSTDKVKRQSRSTADYITDDKTARWTNKRIDDLYDDYASSSPNYSKAYAAYISPEDFLSLTTTNLDRIIQQSRELDADELADYRQPIYLAYDPDSLSSRVVGHEGRHRMVALMASGIKKVPIAIQFYGETGKYDRQPIDVLHLRGQEFSTGKAKGNIMLRDLVPISKAYRAEIEKKFGANGREGVKFSSRNSQLDADYLSAVERSDMDTVQKMVDEAAEIAFVDSKIRKKDGKLRKVYHGTYSDMFTEFDEKLIGTAREGDVGFFGRGFYFAYFKGEAKMYGKNVIEAYVNIENPFNFETELNTYNGERSFDYNASRALFIINFADKFPELADQHYVGVVEHGSDIVNDISLKEFADTFKKVYNTKNFNVHEVDGYSGKEWTVTGDLVEKVYTDYEGEKHTWKEYDFEQRFFDEKSAKNKVNQVYAYMDKVMYDYIDLPRTVDIIQETDFTEALKQRGYDGVIQSEEGDEVVAFYNTQIKSSDPVAYDDNGEVIPLSERFDTTKADIRYQERGDDLYFGVTDDAFDIDFGEDDSVENLIAREFVTHHEDMGEVLQNVADIELTPKKVESIVSRVIRDNLGRLDEESRHTLSIELQMALERVNVDDPQTVSDNIIGAVRKAIEGSTVVDDKAVSDYNQLRDAFKGKKFYLTDEQINQLKEHNMTLDSYRRAMFGKVTIVKRENAKRSINGGYADAHELSLESLHDILESPDEVLGFRSWEWDEKGYDAPNIIKKAFETLRDRREQPITNVYSEEAIDERAVAIAAKITGAVVEAKYNSKQNPYVTKLVADLKQKRTEAVNKQKEKNRQKLAELKQKERERAEKRERELREKYREQRARGYENRKRTEFRGKIRKLMNSFQTRLTKPHDGSYVPRELISQTVEILNSINMDTGRSTKLSEKIAALRNTYDGLKEDAQAYAAYDDTISAMLRGLSDSLGDTSIMDMSLEQLKQTYDTLRSLGHYIRESVKMTDTDEKRTAHQLGREMIAETKDVPKEHSGLLSGYIQTQLRADVMFNRLAGFKKNSTWSQMARMLNDGQLHMTQLQMEFSKIFADVLTDTKQLRTLSDTKHLVDIGLVDDGGNKVPITRGMMISLYMHLQNEDNVRHVMGGGLTIPNMKQYYKGDITKAFGSGQRSVRVGMIDFSKYAEGIKTVIEEQLTDYEKLWIGLAHEFFDEASRNALNDTTMKLYHFKKANVDNYFPIHTDSNYRAASFDSIVRDMSLENSGFMKERIKASNPILLEDIVDVINDQIQKVSKYCSLTIPIKNFQKVYGTTLAGFETSLQKEINKKFSGSRSNTSATKYIDNLITDLTSGRQTSDGPFAKFFSMARGNLAAATLTLNVRVAIAQAASYPTAAAEIGWKPLMKAFVKGGKNNRVISGADRAYIEEHTPLLWLRTQGYSNTEIGDIKELRKQRHQIEGKFRKALGWIEFFDGMTVGRLFYAAQYYVDEQYPTLRRGSEAYKQKVAEVYNNVIEKTQPNYTTMQRPDILRNPNALVKSMTMFMTQRLQNFNIIYDAVGTYNKYRKDLTAGKNGVTAQDLRQAKTKLRRAVVSQTVAALTIVGMKLFADMLMHSMNAYRDDDDELTAESISLALLNNFADTIFGSVLFGSDLYSLLKSAISGERYYGISLSGVDSFTDALEKIVNLRKGIDLDSANKAATAICQLMGIPLNNAEKIGKAIYNWGSDFSGGTFMEAGVDRTNKQDIHRAEMRYTSGDTAGAQELLTAMMEQKKSEGKTDKEARSWLRSQLTSTYKPRYVQAVKDNNTDERTSIRQFLYQSGVYGSLTELDKALAKWADK